ncbi:uncharacterized protein B0T15DRAFT_147393 [Chaetomium strumarium]|uniref:Gfd2/YDR514C-like C-terminal domain-containing protein n=1 Tax=Chaetomium strumarium TaxID=1170767 RepID=A0AAJ0GUX0_9PEZI|nr:hypothetical protein B0T15DRAFT_147393 [Chaetomium strumarium]
MMTCQTTVGALPVHTTPYGAPELINFHYSFPRGPPPAVRPPSLEKIDMEAITQSSNADPPHMGLLRDETLALRGLFGYSNHVPAQPCNPVLDFPGTKLHKTEVWDVRFLGLDVDALQEIEQGIQQFHIGVSIFDTRLLWKSALGLPHPGQENKMTESHYFVVGSPKFSRRKSNKFLFGKFEALSLSDLRARLEGMTLHRDLILVAHGIQRELTVLQRVNIDLRPRYVLDTVKAAQHPLQLSYRCSLEQLLAEFDISFHSLHVAGNDAHFALRAMLMITVRDAERQLDASVLPSWLPTLRAIAHAPLLPADNKGCSELGTAKRSSSCLEILMLHAMAICQQLYPGI